MRLDLFALTIAFTLVAPLVGDAAPSEAVIYSLGGASGIAPTAGVIADAKGNLYSTTLLGGNGSPGHGTVFEVSKGPSGWTGTVLYTFTGGKDGGVPVAGVVADASGALYGTTQMGGSTAYSQNGAGVVFKLTPPHSGQQAWTETVLAAFKGADGAFPNAGLTPDGAGGFYTTTYGGGHFGEGAVVHVTPPVQGATRWKVQVLHSFANADGAEPLSNLFLDAHGVLYGTTPSGGPSGRGVVFSLTPTSKTRWHFQILYAFTGGPDGGNPFAGVVEDTAGNLYGTTNTGGITPCTSDESAGCGVIYELSPQSNGTWLETVLFAFQATGTGAEPEQGTLTFDAAGALYGSTIFGATSFPGNGVIYKLARSGAGWKETVLYEFQGQPDGSGPEDSPLLMRGGTLFGTTVAGGSSDNGTVFELKP